MHAALRGAGVRVELDERSEKLGFKIREAELQKIPVMLVVGDQEAAAGTVTPRCRRGRPRRAEPMALDAFVAELAERDRTTRAPGAPTEEERRMTEIRGRQEGHDARQRADPRAARFA